MVRRGCVLGRVSDQDGRCFLFSETFISCSILEKSLAIRCDYTLSAVVRSEGSESDYEPYGVCSHISP